MKNKKGALTDLIVMLTTFFAITIIIGLAYYLFNAFVPALHSITPGLDNAQHQINNSLNMMASNITAAFSNLNWFAMVDVVGLIMIFFITNAFIKAHPAFMFVYFASIGLAIWFAVYISNTYSSLVTNPVLVGLANVPSLNNFMLHLPIYITIIGFIGAVLLFIRIDYEIV